MFCTFWLGHVLHPTAACNFSISELQKVARDRQFLNILTWKRTSHHFGVPFFISALATCLRARRCSEPALPPSRPTNHWKNAAIRDFPNISRDCVFYLLTFSRLYLLSSDFASLLCFSAVHIVEVSLLNFLRSWFVMVSLCTVQSLLSNLRAPSLCEASILAPWTPVCRGGEQRTQHDDEANCWSDCGNTPWLGLQMELQVTTTAWSCWWVKRSYEISYNYNVLLSDVCWNDINSCCIMLHFGTAQINTNNISICESRYASHANHEVS